MHFIDEKPDFGLALSTSKKLFEEQLIQSPKETDIKIIFHIHNSKLKFFIFLLN